MTLRTLVDRLAVEQAQLPAGAIAVGFSGGMDSSVLLHALAHIAGVRERGLRAIHIDHGLHTDSGHWAEHCRAFSASLGIAFEPVSIQIARDAGTGLEDAARRARQAAFAAHLAPGEILALAHHRDDQAETVLLKLLRGAGPEGLGGMRALRSAGNSHLWRPLLGLARATLAEYARANALDWIDDPSNTDTHLRRNFLRAEILPRLDQRWPDARAALAHSATWARAAADLIESQSIDALEKLRGPDPATMRWRDWLALPDALRDPVLRRWLRSLRLDEPAHLHVAQIQQQLRDAASDRLPCVRWQATEVRRYRELLYAMRPAPTAPKTWQARWDGSALGLPAGGTLALQTDAPRDLDGLELTVRYRQGGELLKPAGKPHTRELRLLLQEAAMPPWLRARVPLIFSHNELLAAGDLFLSDAARDMLGRLGAHIVWERDEGWEPRAAG
ncbi:MAG: tRNA lysidine(34) synthetase TilS [Rudaea sp.]|nr:tRNA lysidine(34) synthetase TilS [Rudaea sp.]